MLAALVTAVAFAGSASAQCGNGLLIKFDADAFAYETNYDAPTYTSSPGSQLNVVGIVSLFCAPLNDLNAPFMILLSIGPASASRTSWGREQKEI